MANQALGPTDPTSFSNPEEVMVTYIGLDLEVNFNKHILTGTVDLHLKKVKEDTDIVILDTRDLNISSVKDKETSQDLSYTLGENVGAFGSKLTIKLPPMPKQTCVLHITYQTTPECTALQWLKPEQTAGKRQPYLFSQCQAIHCRSIIPCQDTPATKCPYGAHITAPSEIKILMSAILVGSEDIGQGKTRYQFQQEICMPSYLIAIVGGDLVSKKIGPRSHVWSEQEFIDQAAYEFAETEAMLKTAEDLLGPYVWGSYDLLVLPPSFPYGGMENPCLTFVTPTLLAGDRSLADVVAHEISHSWTGNLATNKTFEHFWLNEGHTKFVERKIVARMKGGEGVRQFLAASGWTILSETVSWLNEGHTMFVERKIGARLKGGEAFRQFMAASGWEVLKETVNVLGAEHPYTRLVPDLKGVDPDDAFSSVPYEKGHALLFYLESLLGGPEKFEPFVRGLIEEYKFKSFTTDDWKAFLMNWFQEEVSAGALDSVDWDGWLNGVGMPPVKPEYDMTMAKACEYLAERWKSCTDGELDQFSQEDIQKFLPAQTMAFLTQFLNQNKLSSAKISKMGDVYNFNTVRNSEIKFRWLRLRIQSHCDEAIPVALQFVTEQGRMKFTNPLYRDLYEWEKSRDQAIANFQANRNQMHSTTVNVVAKTLKIT